MILTYCFFMLQGKKSIVKNKIRGGELVAPKELTKYLKKNRIASSIKIRALATLRNTTKPFSIKNFVLYQPNTRWLFITTTPAQRKTLSPLITAQIEVALNALMMKDPAEQNQNTWFIMDELPALGKIPSLKTALAESRKYGGCIVAGLQNIHQLTALYGQNEALNLLDQFNTRFMFRVGDQETARITSSILGEIEKRETNESLSFGANTIRDGVNLGTIEKRHPLVLPTEILTLPNLACFVKLAGSCPVTKLIIKYNPTLNLNFQFEERKAVLT